MNFKLKLCTAKNNPHMCSIFQCTSSSLLTFTFFPRVTLLNMSENNLSTGLKCQVIVGNWLTSVQKNIELNVGRIVVGVKVGTNALI